MKKQDNDFLNGTEGEMSTDDKTRDYIRKCLNDASEYDLESEVILTALEIMKGNPEEDPADAFEMAMTEWDV